MEMKPANALLLRDRWPDIHNVLTQVTPLLDHRFVSDTPDPTLVVRSIQLASAYDSQREAELQADWLDPNTPAVAVYGIGTGQLPRSVRRRCAAAKVDVFILEPEVFFLVLCHFDCSDWLSDQHCQLHIAPEENRLHFPFVVSPPMLRLLDVSRAQLRDRLLIEADARLKTNRRSQQEAQWHRHIRQNRSCLAGDLGVDRLFHTLGDRPVAVAAAGPSLSDHYAWLKRQRDALRLVAVNTALAPLLSQQIIPDIVVVIDSDETAIPAHFDTDLALLQHSALVYFPVVSPAVLSLWPGNRFLACGSGPFYSTLKHACSANTLFCAGSVVHPAIDLAARMTEGEIHLLGADFAFTDATSVHVSGVSSPPGTDAQIQQASLFIANAQNEQVPSNQAMLGFLRDLENYLACNPQIRLIQHGQRGASIKGAFPWQG